MPSRSPFGARMQWPEPAYTEQSLARLARPTKGGAVRIRIALATAIAVIALPAIFFAVFSSTSAASARLTRHEASSHSRVVKIDDTLMSYSQARKVAKMVAYSNAVELGQEETYLTEVAYLKSVAVQEQAAAQALQPRKQLQRKRRRHGHEPLRQRRRRPRRRRRPQRRRLAGSPMPPAPTRQIGPASVSTSPTTTTPRATAARTSSSSERGPRSRGCLRPQRTTRQRYRMPPLSSSFHSAAGSRGAPATSAGCDKPT